LSEPFDEKAAEKAVVARLRKSRDIAVLGGLMAALVTALAIGLHAGDRSWEDALRWFSAGLTDASFVFNVYYYREQIRQARREREAYAHMRSAAAAFADMLRVEMAKRGIEATVEVGRDDEPTITRH
jgi:hypothetical protein